MNIHFKIISMILAYKNICIVCTYLNVHFCTMTFFALLIQLNQVIISIGYTFLYVGILFAMYISMLASYWIRLDQVKHTRKDLEQTKVYKYCLDLFNMYLDLYAGNNDLNKLESILKQLNKYLSLLELNL